MKINRSVLKAEIKDSFFTLLQFLRNPISEMQKLPEWEWPKMLLLLAAMASICGAIAGVVSGNLFDIFTRPIILPISSVVMTGIASGFFYYVFKFFFQREVSYQKLYTNLIFASIPAHILVILDHFLRPASLIGLAAGGILLTVGFSANFGLDRKKVGRLMGAMFGIYLVFWIFSSINLGKSHREYRQKATPESLEILERELRE